MLNCVIIDDEQAGIDTLRAIIGQKFADRLCIVGTATSGQTGKALIDETSPDIVFLDVEMPGFTGMQLLAEFETRNFSVVFTTAHPEYALQAIKSEAVDYLLKPISLQELNMAVEKCERRMVLLQGSATDGDKKISLPTGKGSVLAERDEIIRLESDNNYTTVYFTNRPKLVIARTLKIFDEQLSDKGFYRIHQSHLVNIKHVRSHINGDTSYAVLSNGEKVEIARRRKQEFLQAIRLAL